MRYTGIPDRPEYMARVHFKRRVYATNEIPAPFVYPKDLQGPRWPGRLVERIERAGGALTAAPARIFYTGPRGRYR